MNRPEREGETTEPRTKRGCLGTALIAAAILLAVIGMLTGLFFLNNRPPRIVIPTPKMPKPNGWDDFVLAGKYIDALGLYSKPKAAPISGRLSRSDMQAIASLRRGLRKPYRHPMVRGPESPSSVAGLARCLAGVARHYESRGDWDEAMRCKLDCIDFGVTLPHGAPLMVGLIAATEEQMGEARIGRLLPKLSPAALKSAAARLETICAKRVSYADVMAEEADLYASYVIAMIEDPMLQRKIKSPMSWFRQYDPYDLATLPDKKRKQKPTVRRAWDNLCFAFGNKTKMVREVHDYYVNVGRAQDRAYIGKVHVPEPDNYIGVSSFWDDLDGERAWFAKAEAQFALIQVEVALRRYRADTGSYPARLRLLKPAHLKHIPYDPFGGGSLHYRSFKHGQDFLLYSIGYDLKDDGGKGFQGLWDSPGDIVLDR